MDNTLTPVTNVFTRPARDAAGNYKLVGGGTIDYYDPSNASQYIREDFTSFKTYTLTGIDGVYDGMVARQMSIGQLAMAICLKRAAEVELDIVRTMESIAKNTAQINAFTMVFEKLSEKNDGINDVGDEFSEIGFSEDEIAQLNNQTRLGWPNDVYTTTYYDYWLNHYGFSVDTSASKSPSIVASMISAIESRLDSLNTISQEKLIDLQSMTARRDQSYDLIATMLKSLNTTLVGNANNL